MLACFHICENIPSLKDRLNKTESGIAISYATAFNIFLLIESGQVNLSVFMFY